MGARITYLVTVAPDGALWDEMHGMAFIHKFTEEQEELATRCYDAFAAMGCKVTMKKLSIMCASYTSTDEKAQRRWNLGQYYSAHPERLGMLGDDERKEIEEMMEGEE